MDWEKWAEWRLVQIIALPLHGTGRGLRSPEEAIAFIQEYREDGGSTVIERYEVQLRYSKGDVIEGKFRDKETAIDFLKTYIQ